MIHPAIGAAAFATATLLSAGSISAATVNATLAEVGADIVFTFSGEVDLTGLTLAPGGPNVYPANVLFPSDSGVVSVPDAFLTFFTTPTPGAIAFGTGTGVEYGRPIESVSTGDNLGFYADASDVAVWFLPDGYVSGSSLSGSATFFNLDFSDIGATEGTYSYSIGATDISLTVGNVPAIPLPAGAWLLLSGIAAVAATRRRTT